MNIRFAPGVEREVARMDQRLAALAGVDRWPPADDKEWQTVLERAGFKPGVIEQFIDRDLPEKWREGRFTTELVAGLAVWFGQQENADARLRVALTEDGMRTHWTAAQFAELLGCSDRQIERCPTYRALEYHRAAIDPESPASQPPDTAPRLQDGRRSGQVLRQRADYDGDGDDAESWAPPLKSRKSKKIF